MASDRKTVDGIVAQASGAGAVSARAMFGEYALYLDDKMVGLICDDRLFIKPTAPGRAFVDAVDEAPPYPGAKPSIRIGPDQVANAAWLSELVAITAAALPTTKKKPRKG